MIPETIGKLQILQQVEVPTVVTGNTHLANKGSPMYVGITPQASYRVGQGKKEKENEIKKI